GRNRWWQLIVAQGDGARPRTYWELVVKAHQQTPQRERERPLKSLDVAERGFVDEAAFLAGVDRLIDEFGEIDPRAGIAVNATCHLRELLERPGFEFRQHHRAALVFDEAA